MTGPRWTEVWRVYCELRDSSSADRSEALGSLPDDIREEVQQLLEQGDAVSQVSQFGKTASANPSSPAHPQIPPGTEIGRYVITGLIGAGGFGRVYSAHDKDLRRGVAIKILSAGSNLKDKRVVEEARLASALNHPNILTIYETIEVDGQPAIVMEFVAGSSLRAELAKSKGPLPLSSVIAYGLQISRALGAAHAVGIVHRDVKPENILIRPDSYLKLVDFGLASARVPAAASSSDVPGWQPFQGTLSYASPEQLKGPAASPASDIFALGMVLYEMAAGVHPFRMGTPLETAGAISSAPPSPPNRLSKGLPVELNQLILSMLEKDPALRPTASDVTRRLAALSVQPGGTARPKWVLVAAAAGILAALAGGALAWRLWLRTPPSLAIRLKTTPLTGREGREREPAISGDGRFVVFEWQQRIDGPYRTLVREIGSEDSVELPIAPPFAWVPRTDRIGFKRTTGDSHSLYTISRKGGSEEKVFTVSRDFYQMQWAPDGSSVVYLSENGTGAGTLFQFTPATGEHRQISFPTPDTRGETAFAISADGRKIAFRRATKAESSDIYVSDFPQPSNLRRLSFLEAPGSDNIVWLRDGSGLISSTFLDANYSLWLYPILGAAPPTKLTSLGVDAYGLDAASGSNRLVWQNSYDDENIWRVSTAGGRAERVIASPLRDADPAVAASGMIAFRCESSGFPELWLAGPAGAPPRKLTSMEGLVGSPRWSPDGRKLAFDARPKRNRSDIFVADCDPVAVRCGTPRQITWDAAADALPNWSHDGNSVYFASQRSGDWQLWRTRADGSDRSAVQVTSEGGFYSAESHDGRWLYYSRIDSPQTTGVWRQRLGAKLPLDSPGEMILPLAYEMTDTWNLHGSEILYTAIDLRQSGSIEAFDLHARRKRMVFAAGQAPIRRGLSVSPDGKWAYFTRSDRTESNVVYVDYEVLH